MDVPNNVKEMNPKKKHTLINKVFCLKDLLVDAIEELKANDPDTLKFANDIISYCERMNDSVADTATIQKSTYFSNISNKIDTILRKEFDENM